MASEHEYGVEQGQDDPVPGGTTPGEHQATEREAGESEETGVVYERATGEPETTPHDEVLTAEETEGSNPTAAGPQGLQGGMGISSERTGPDGGARPVGGIEGTGTTGSARDATDGTQSTSRGWVEDPDAPLDRENTADVPSHENHPRKNPGHSHG
jgi:hypothetical protein